MKIANALAVPAMVCSIAACTVPAPRYEPSYDNVQLLKGGGPVKIVDFKSGMPKVGKITLRGSSLKSPYEKDMVHYLQAALQSEFEKAGLLSQASTKSVTAVVTENSIDASGASVGRGKISATFKVLDSERQIYEKAVTVADEWESSFIGAIAIPRAAAAYPALAKELFNTLYSDRQFVGALK